MSEINRDTTNVSTQCRLSFESDSSSVNCAIQKLNIPPPYPGSCTRMATRQLDRHQSQPMLSYAGVPSATAFEMLKRRVQMLEVENRRLMSSQGQLVADTNKRVEMYMVEIKTLKDELKVAEHNNKELRDLCCFLDDDRQKTRQLSYEWQKFGRYTSEVMKQEVLAYQKNLHELEHRQQLLMSENDELKRLCLYLDEQRQALIREREAIYANTNNDPKSAAVVTANESTACDSSGCGSSATSPRGSADEGDLAARHSILVSQPASYDRKQEKTLEMITQQMQTSICEAPCGDTEHWSYGSNSRQEQILGYMHSLEGRIRQLEIRNQQSNDSFWQSNGNIVSEIEGRTIVERNELNRPSSNSLQSSDLDEVTFEGSTSHNQLLTRPAAVSKDGMLESSSTMTSSGTTFCSSETDESADRAVFVMGDERDAGASVLEVRTLGPINEEKEDDLLGSAHGVGHSHNNSQSGNNAEVLADENSLSFSGIEDPMEKLKEPDIAEEPSVEMPPTIAPVSDSVNRLSQCSSDISSEGILDSRQSAELLISSPIRRKKSTIPVMSEDDSANDRILSDLDRSNSTVRDSLSEAVEVLRVHEMAARKSMRGLSAQETAIVQHMCQMAWDSLDRKSHSLNSTDNQQKNLKSHMTAV